MINANNEKFFGKIFWLKYQNSDESEIVHFITKYFSRHKYFNGDLSQLTIIHVHYNSQ